jgi:microcystin-dependent protein
MSEPYIGEIRMLPYTFAPKDWALCSGQYLQIAEHTALFAVIGITYGGDGRVTFRLPDLNGRTPMGSGHGPGLSSYQEGWAGGWYEIPLNDPAFLPTHTHIVVCDEEKGTSESPTGAFIGRDKGGKFYKDDPEQAQLVNMADEIMANAGHSTTQNPQPHSNRQPYTGVNFCICLDGVFPPRN